MLICIQHHQASITRDQPERPVRRRECAANYHRNEQTRQYYYFIFCPCPASLLLLHRPIHIFCLAARDWRPGDEAAAAPPLCGSRDQGTALHALRLRSRDTAGWDGQGRARPGVMGACALLSTCWRVLGPPVCAKDWDEARWVCLGCLDASRCLSRRGCLQAGSLCLRVCDTHPGTGPWLCVHT